MVSEKNIFFKVFPSYVYGSYSTAKTKSYTLMHMEFTTCRHGVH